MHCPYPTSCLQPSAATAAASGSASGSPTLPAAAHAPELAAAPLPLPAAVSHGRRGNGRALQDLLAGGRGRGRGRGERGKPQGTSRFAAALQVCMCMLHA